MAIKQYFVGKEPIKKYVANACPFCGCADQYITPQKAFNAVIRKNPMQGMLSLKCKDCGVEMPLYTVPENKYWAGVKALVDKWNNRKEKKDGIKED